MSQDRQFLFQVNVTRDCDLRCTHCYISTEKKVRSQFMTEDQFTEVMFKIADFMDKDAATERKYQIADIHVVGGEPSMLGEEFYLNTMPAIRERFSHCEQEIKLCLVTNLMQPRALKVARLFNIVTTSYEFNTRFTKAKQEERWINNIKTLVSEGKPPGITMTITQDAIGIGAHKILEEFYGIGVRNMHMGFFIPSGDGKANMLDLFPEFEETSKFLQDATDWYLEKKRTDPDLYVNPVNSLIGSIKTGLPSDDIVCPIIPGSLDIDWDGNTGTCMETGGEVEYNSLGNVFATDVSGILEDRPYLKERRKAITPQPHCIGCDEIDLCQSACGILHQYWAGEGECPGFKGFIKHTRKLVEQGEFDEI